MPSIIAHPALNLQASVLRGAGHGAPCPYAPLMFVVRKRQKLIANRCVSP